MNARILVVDASPPILKVVGAILEARGYSVTGTDDGDVALAALREDEPFALVLLEFQMPTMNGLQFCRAMRQVERLRSLPVVLMTNRSERIRDTFVELSGAIDVITKPFDEEALVTVVEHALVRAARPSTQMVAVRMTSEPPISKAPSSAPPSIAPTSGPSEEATRSRDAKLFVTRLASLIAPLLAKLDRAEVADEGKIAQTLLDDLSTFALQSLGATLRDADFAGGRDVVLAGDLSKLPIGAVLQLLQMEQQSGSLVVVHANSEMVVTMRGGLIDLVQSRGAGDEFRLGRYFIQEGWVSAYEIDTLMLHSDSPLGLTLLESGKIDDKQLRAALHQQSSELIYEMLRWPRGRFELRNKPASPLADSARLGMTVASVVIEGFRRVDEWRMIEARVGRFEDVLVRDPVAIESIGIEKLTEQELSILDFVDGKQKIRDIIPLTNMSSFDACKIIFQLMEARLVRRKPR
ncbi:MAG: DUF4388 domain-containing protein [Polyangiaceae bacterium]